MSYPTLRTVNLPARRESEWGREGGRDRGREARDLFPGMINDVSGDLDRYAHGDGCK